MLIHYGGQSWVWEKTWEMSLFQNQQWLCNQPLIGWTTKYPQFEYVANTAGLRQAYIALH